MATSSARLFCLLARSAELRSAKLPLPSRWRALAALRPYPTVGTVLAAASTPAPLASRRAVLSALLSLAPPDPLATEALLVALVPGLRSVAAELCRWAPVEGGEVDALVATGACEAVGVLGGRSHPWADRAVVSRARDYARSRLLAESRWRRRSARPPDDFPYDDDSRLAELFAWDVLERAVARGGLHLSAARLVWAARVEGRAARELASLSGGSPEAASMARLRAERALRGAVA